MIIPHKEAFPVQPRFGESVMSRKSVLVPLAIIVAGASMVAILVLSRRPPDQQPAHETARIVDAIVVRPMTVVPSVTAFGEAAPDRTWAAVARVSGRVAWQSDKLKDGDFVREGDELLHLDDSEYRIAISRAKAEIEQRQARLDELAINRANLEIQVDLFRQALEFRERELERQQNLQESRAVSASVVDQQRIAVLEQRRAFAAQSASLEQLPSQIDFLRAELAAAEANLRQAEFDLASTLFKAPFDGRLDGVAVEINQYVPVGQTFLKLNSIARAEILIGMTSENLAMLAGEPVEKVVDDIARQRPAESRRSEFTVYVDGGRRRFQWPAHFGRISPAIDTATRMTQLVVVVDEPYRRAAPGEGMRPALSKGTFCTVVARGGPQPGQLVIPRKAIHEGNVYVVDADSRLELRPIRTKYFLGSHAIVEEGVREGETVATSDIVPAVPGMLLDARIGDGYHARAAADIGPDSRGNAFGEAAE